MTQSIDKCLNAPRAVRNTRRRSGNRVGRHALLFLGLFAGALFNSEAVRAEAPLPVRVGVLQFGTVNWELQSMTHHGIDTDHGVAVNIIPFASNDATRIALLGGGVDIIVSDWLWVSRERSEGRPLTFVPYSSSVGAIMVSGDSDIQSLADLQRRRIGVAGGALDKSWLLLQGYALKAFAFDLAASNDVVFGAPPLLAEKARSGELEAVLNYWHYCARLEADGFRRLISAEEAANRLGASGPTSAIGYVFDESWANDKGRIVEGFIRASRATKKLLAESDVEWQRLRDSGAIRDSPEALAVLRNRFREGIPARALDDEIRDAQIIYRLLADLGGETLVGDSSVLVSGTYWEGPGSGL